MDVWHGQYIRLEGEVKEYHSHKIRMLIPDE